MARSWIGAVLAGGMVAAGFAVQPFEGLVHPASGPVGLDVHETHASATLLGQFRTSVSAWLWVRTDLYLHNGVEMRPVTDRESAAGVGAAHSEDGLDEHLHGEGGITTVVPSAERDFRGLFGDLERATSAYKPMEEHGHTDPRSSLPLFRLMTWIDPKFVRAWTTGASVMSWGKDIRTTDRALEFLASGRQANPESVAIENGIGTLLLRKKLDFPAAIASFERARKLGHTQPETMDEDERDALLDAYRWLALAYRQVGALDRTAEVSEEGLQRFPDDAVLGRLRHPSPSPLVRKPTSRR